MVGGDDHLVHLPQRRLRGQGFLLEDVQRRARQLVRPEGRDQRRLVDDRPAGDVYQDGAVADRVEFRLADLVETGVVTLD